MKNGWFPLLLSNANHPEAHTKFASEWFFFFSSNRKQKARIKRNGTRSVCISLFNFIMCSAALWAYTTLVWLTGMKWWSSAEIFALQAKSPSYEPTHTGERVQSFPLSPNCFLNSIRTISGLLYHYYDYYYHMELVEA